MTVHTQLGSLGPIRLAPAIVAVALAIVAIFPASSGAAGAPTLVRTLRVAPPGVNPNGPSADPSIGGGGVLVAFDSQASNLGPGVGNRRLRNVYVFNILNRRVVLVSAGAGGPANGSSFTPSLSAAGQVVAFTSRATNLVAGTSPGFSEVYARYIGGPIGLVSRTFGNQPPDGDSSQPAVSANGRFIAFTSTADNLVAGDDNATADVFVADLGTGKIQRISVSSAGAQADGPSYNPSISDDGRFVSFTSAANNLAPGDINRVPDVFVHDMLTGTTEQVSVSSTGTEQNRSIAPPFAQISDVSGDGHYVVFDSDATNLVRRDTNGHTDVYRYDLLTGRVSRVSTSSAGRQGDNDSFAPATSTDGRVTVFESFADNLASPWVPNENVFAQDLPTQSTLTLDVAPDGGPRGPEIDSQLLQRPAVSPDGLLVAFASGADNLVPGDYNGTDDLFVRVITPPTTTILQAPPATTSSPRPVVEFRGSSPLASYGLCDLDGHERTCPAGRPFRLPRVRRGHHVLTVRAGAPGTLFDPKGVTVGFTEG